MSFETLAVAGVGFLAAVLLDVIRDRLERDRRREEWAYQHETEAHREHLDFQRKTLLEVQEVMLDLGRHLGQQFGELALLEKSQSTADWARLSISSDLDQATGACVRRAKLLESRIEDPSLREAIAEMRALSTTFQMAGSRGEAEDALKQYFHAATGFNEGVGAQIRTRHSDASASSR